MYYKQLCKYGVLNLQGLLASKITHQCIKENIKQTIYGPGILFIRKPQFHLHIPLPPTPPTEVLLPQVSMSLQNKINHLKEKGELFLQKHRFTIDHLYYTLKTWCNNVPDQC